MAEYVELDMRIGQEDATLRVAGQEPYEGPTDFTPETLEHLEELCSPASSWKVFGSELFRATFQEGALQGYKELKEVAQKSDKRYRLRLNIRTRVPRIHQLWWECLCDPGPPVVPLGRARWIPLSRSLRQGVVRDPLKVDKLRVLVAVSNPEDLGQAGGDWAQYPRLSKEEEEQECAAVKSVFDKLDRVVCDFQDKPDKPASLAQIRRRLYHDEFHVLHLVAHGGFVNEKGFLLLERDDDEKVDPVGEEDLGLMVEGLENLQLVVLATSFSAQRLGVDVFGGLAPRIVEYGVPAVIAMQQQVEKETAQLFTHAFYEALLQSRETQGLVDAAVNAARDALFFRLLRTAPWAWTIPVLFMHGPGKLFELPEVTPRPGGAARAAGMARESAVQQEPAARTQTVMSPGAGPPAFDQNPSDEKCFSQSAIYRIHDLLIKAGFGDPDTQDNLFGGIDPAYVKALPDKGAPADRLLAVLNRLNTTRRLTTGELPFDLFLYNAVKISHPLTQSEELNGYLKKLREPTGGPSIAAPGYGSRAQWVTGQTAGPKTGGY